MNFRKMQMKIVRDEEDIRVSLEARGEARPKQYRKQKLLNSVSHKGVNHETYKN